MLSLMALAVLKLTEKEHYDDHEEEDFTTNCINVRYTDQNPRSTKLKLGGYGQIFVLDDSLILIGEDCYSNESSNLILTIILKFNPILDGLIFLMTKNKGPAEIIAANNDIECIHYDPASQGFAIIHKGTAFPFKVIKCDNYDAFKIESLLKDRYGEKVRESKLPFEHRRLLFLFLFVLALIGVGALLFIFVYNKLDD